MNAAGSTDVLATALDAATALAELVPSSAPLTVAPMIPGSVPPPDALAVVASFTGSPSAELILVADQVVAEALEGAGGASVSLADALRPALEAATGVLGAGVLGTAEIVPVGDALEQDGVVAFALQAGGQPQGWFGIRVREHVTAPPAVARIRPEQDNMRLLYDVEMTLSAEIGRTKLPVRQVLDLVPGSVIELDRAAGSPADLMVNGRLIARGEVVVIDEDYGIRITEIVDQAEHTA